MPTMNTYLFEVPALGMKIWHRHATDDEAMEAARQASESAAEAKRANERLSLLLEEERRRVQKLEALTKGVKFIPDVSLE